MAETRVTEPAHTDHLTPDLIRPVSCVKCGSRVVRTTRHTDAGIAQETWLCSNAHLIHLKWVA